MASAFGSGDPAPRRSADRVRVIVYAALVLLAVGALALRAGWINTRAAAGSPRYVRLRGLTGERQPMSVWLDGSGHVHELAVKLIGLCENGGSFRSAGLPRVPASRSERPPAASSRASTTRSNPSAASPRTRSSGPPHGSARARGTQAARRASRPPSCIPTDVACAATPAMSLGPSTGRASRMDPPCRSPRSPSARHPRSCDSRRSSTGPAKRPTRKARNASCAGIERVSR